MAAPPPGIPLQPPGQPAAQVNPFVDTIQRALHEYRAIAVSHAVSADKRARMLSLIGQIQVLMNGNFNLAPVRAAIDARMDDLMALSPTGIRPGMTSIPNQGDVRPRQPYWEMVKVGHLYHARVPGQPQGVPANGHYVFTILTARPWEVRLGQRIDGGHTAISRGADVYYAGEILFQNGYLIRWNDESGHYHPPANLHPQVRTLLPPGLFQQAH